MEFIEVSRIITNKKGVQLTALETLKISDIRTFRPWYKTLKDTFKGEATLVVLYNKSKVTGVENVDDDDKSHTMLVSEDYKDFLARLGGRVIINGTVNKNISH